MLILSRDSRGPTLGQGWICGQAIRAVSRLWAQCSNVTILKSFILPLISGLLFKSDEEVEYARGPWPSLTKSSTSQYLPASVGQVPSCLQSWCSDSAPSLPHLAALCPGWQPSHLGWGQGWKALFLLSLHSQSGPGLKLGCEKVQGCISGQSTVAAVPMLTT